MSILDINRYRVHVAPIKRICDRKEPKQFMDFIGEYAATANCPVIAVAHYVGEIYGYTPEILGFIERHVKYYKLREVRGVK